MMILNYVIASLINEERKKERKEYNENRSKLKMICTTV